MIRFEDLPDDPVPAKPAQQRAIKKEETLMTDAKKSGLSTTLYMPDTHLARILGQTEGAPQPVTRPEITKGLWAYIKEHKLQDADSKRRIIPDGMLAEVCGPNPFDMMKLAGMLGMHLTRV